jgi:hypothetical protein
VLPRMPVIPPPMSAAFPAAFTKSGAIPGGGGPAYDAGAPLTEGCSMEAYQEVRAEMQLGRGYANRGNRAPRRGLG